MANWGQPDFDARTEAQKKIDAEAPALQEKLKAEGKYWAWMHNDEVSPGYSPDDVRVYCVQNQEWQKIRLSMKGIPTHKKLAILHAWWNTQREKARQHSDTVTMWATEVQVGNYLGALRRGGQLDANNRVRKYI